MTDFLAEPQPPPEAGKEAQPRQQELTPEQFRAFVRSTADALYQMSPDWSEMRHLRSEGFLADTDQPNPGWLVEYVHEDDRDLVVRTYQEAVAGKHNFDLEHRVRQLDGSIGWTHSRAVPLLDAQGEIREWFGAATDITAQRQARQLLDQQALQFETLLDNAPIGVCLLDQGLRVKAVNPIAMQVFARVPEVLGRPFDEVIHVLWPERYAHQVVAMCRRALETGELQSTGGGEADAGDAFEAPERHEWHVTRITLPGDGPGVVCYFKDLSTLARSKQALEEADRRKDEFLATLAHELRTPLGPLRTCLHVLRLEHQAACERDPAVAPAGPDHLLTVMEQQVRHMVRLVDDLLEVSRITRGDIGLRCESLDLGQVLKDTVDASAPLIDGAGHRLELDLATEPLPLHGDPVRLTQVVSNLINNAVKYTPPGGRIRVAARREGDCAHVTVADSGAGIPADALASVFDMFVQGEHTRSHGVGGLGIGLTLVRNLVVLHGGSVEARSEGPGCGSQFVVRLPLQEVPVASADPLASEGAPVTSRSILVIDDSHQNADTLALFLEMSGHQVRTAYDGASGVALAQSQSPDVVLLDLGMPGLDGFETCRRLRALPAGEQVHVVAVTGWGQKNDRLRTAQSGFDQHLVKPVDPVALLKLVESCVGPRAAAVSQLATRGPNGSSTTPLPS